MLRAFWIIRFAVGVSWACSVDKHHLCDGYVSGPGTGACGCKGCYR